MLSSLTASLSSALFFDPLSPDTLQTLNDISTVPGAQALFVSRRNFTQEWQIATISLDVLNDDNMPRKRNWLPVINCLQLVLYHMKGTDRNVETDSYCREKVLDSKSLDYHICFHLFILPNSITERIEWRLIKQLKCRHV